ncbi:MAG: hybrid sensor histidine kinase/response regulator [Anaerolineae bacterium]|nr:hybrid sensor histidine kinase/response regulator [Anaerolineae bacterium]
MPDLNPALMQTLLNTFRAEAAEHLQNLNKALLHIEAALEESERQPLIQEAFRAAHSLKGAARAVSINDIEVLAHAMENVFQQARDNGLVLNVAICDILYDNLDAIEAVLNQREADVEALKERLQAALSPSQKPPAEAAPSPPQKPPAEAAPTNHQADEAEVTTQQPKEAVAPAPQTAANNSAAADTIRVSVSKLDDLMAQVGELLVSRISAEQRLNEIIEMRYQINRWSKSWREIKSLLPRIQGETAVQLHDALHRHASIMDNFVQMFGDLDQATNRDTLRLQMVMDNLQEKVRHVRMIPFQTITLVLERVVRDAARTEHKQVEFEVHGQDIELDKKVLELLKDPLIHLLRNAVGHGIEAPEERIKAGKDGTGRVTVQVLQRGSEVHIHVMDDGRGFDLEKLRDSYAKHYQDADLDMTNDDISMAFMPGVSTASEITELAGRGIGLDIVRERLEKMQGRITIINKPGQGAQFELIVPTSMAMTRGLIVRAGNDQYAIPLLSVEKIIHPESFVTISGKRMLKVDDKPLPLARLSTLLERPYTPAKGEQDLAIILTVADQKLALLVNDAVTEQEFAVKPLETPLKCVRNVTGTAMLGNGEPIIVLSPADLVRSARGSHMASTTVVDENRDVKRHANILVVDDSITTRTLEKNILEAAGYTVFTATDGREGIQKLRDNPVDIIVSDIEMPNMNGFELTRTVREDEDYSEMPLILVTSLESSDDRERGMLAGANAYIVKRGFDQAELLTTIEQLL